MGDQDEKKPVTSIDLNEVTPKASPESLQANGVEAGYTGNTVPGVEHREGVGVSAPSSTVQPPTVNLDVDNQAAEANKVAGKSTEVATPKPALEGMGEEENEPWWLSGETVDANGVKRLITLDEVVKADPSLKGSLKGGDFLYNILNYRQKKGLSALDPSSYKMMLGRHSLDKTVKQEKRDRVRNFLADTIQPVTDVLKAAVAYGYGKAGRTFIPVDKAHGPSLGDKLREAEKIRAKQNWDEWADTFKRREAARIAAEVAEKRRKEAMEDYVTKGQVDVENHRQKKLIDQGFLTPKQRLEEEQLAAYYEARRNGKSHEQAMYDAVFAKKSTVKTGKSGGGKSSSSSSNNKAQYYVVGRTRYSSTQREAALKRHYGKEHPGSTEKDFAQWRKNLGPGEEDVILEKYIEK